MDDTTVNWVKWVALFACVLVATVGGCTMHENYLIGSAIQHGASPMAASCAIAPGGQQHGECTIVAMQAKAAAEK